MIDFDVWWNSAAADEFRATHEDMEGSEVRPIWIAAVLATLAHTKAAIASAEAVERQAEPGADERAAFEKYAASNFYNCTCDIYGGYMYQTARTAWAAWQARAAQSGQQADVAGDVVTRDSAIAAIYYVQQYNGPGRALDAIDMLAAPTQQQEGGDA